MPERRPHLPAFRTRPRCCTSITGLIYAVGGLNSAGILQLPLAGPCFAPKKLAWPSGSPPLCVTTRVLLDFMQLLDYAVMLMLCSESTAGMNTIKSEYQLHTSPG